MISRLLSAWKGVPEARPVSPELRTNIDHAASAIHRALGLRPFDVQKQGAIAMAQGRIAEMQTGEGKTLTAVMTAYHLNRSGVSVHVLTANDYLARRDAEWMLPAYRELGMAVGYIQQGMKPEERRRAYQCDVTYATPNEVGFDFLRDGLALETEEQVQRGFGAALIDEADSILIDEARIPLVIAGGDSPPEALVRQIATVVKSLRTHVDYWPDAHGRNVVLADRGEARIEAALGCGNLYEEQNLGIYTAVSEALHAEFLLRRDVDYVVKDGKAQLVDEFKGRIADLRRWPAGLQTAVEAKEGLPLQTQGHILGSITLQSLVRLYGFLCGMTGTAVTQAAEFSSVYGLEVEPVPTHRPMIRQDLPDVIFPTREVRDQAVVNEIAKTHAAGRPVLVGTASIAESEALSHLLETAGIPHKVLNARNDAEEAKVVAQAGQRGAVTISTNMAGRGTDIQLGDGVVELGGLYVIGTNRHESRRIDNQLRGRAGRQGDPGSSRFFVSLQDDLMTRFGLAELKTVQESAGRNQVAQTLDHIQRIIEGKNLEIRQTLLKYDALIERQRRITHELRREVLSGERECANRRAALLAIDDLWSNYLAEIAELRSGIHWISYGGRDPLNHFLREADALFLEMEEQMEVAIEDAGAEDHAGELQRGATWTYVTTDQPFGNDSQRFLAGIAAWIRDTLRAHDR